MTDPVAVASLPPRLRTVSAALLLVCVAGMALHVHRGGGFAFDAPMLAAVRHWQSPLLDAVFVPITVMGYAGGVVPGSVVLVLALLLRRHWRRAVFAATAMAGAGACNQAIKQAVARARPDVGAVPLPESTFSFPSAHAMGAMALACVLVVLAWDTRWRWPVAIALPAFAVLVGVSRVYLGVHHPSDVLAGWMAGAGWVMLVATVLRSRLGEGHDQR